MAARSPSSWRFILSQVYRGTSVNRALLHQQVMEHIVLKGTVLDVGGGHRQSYLTFAEKGQVERLVALDIQPRGIGGIRGSVTQMPIRGSSIDTVLCFNLLEHVYDHRAALMEMHRVMRPGAVLAGWTPFGLSIHGAPNDYWRYTPDALRHLLEDAGLSIIRVEASGGAFLSAFDLLNPYVVTRGQRRRLLGRLVRVTGAILALLATRFVVATGRMLSKQRRPSLCPNGVWFMASREGEAECPLPSGPC